MRNTQTLDPNIRKSVEALASSGRRDLATIVDRAARKKRVGKIDPAGEPEGLIVNPNDFDNSYHASTTILCKDIADILTKRFPDWLWAVQPQEFGQVINIFNLHLHTEFGYTIRMQEIMNDPSRREAYRAGHEILRRFNMPDRFSAERVAEMPRDANGMGIPDISDFKDKGMVRDAEVATKLATGEWELVEVDGERYIRTKQ